MIVGHFWYDCARMDIMLDYIPMTKPRKKL